MTEAVCNSAVPFLFLLAGPLIAVAWQLGAMRSSIVRCALGALVLGILWVKSPESGFDRAQLDAMKLLLAAAMVVLLSLRERLALETRRFGLVVAAIVGILLHYNVGAFHGGGSFVHVHDVAHYYLGAKYAPELGYGELYAAVARAELEAHGGEQSVTQARDLVHGGIVPIADVAAAGAVPARKFDAERWKGFRADVETLHRLMGPQFSAFLTDHGYNPTPVWSLIGGAIANRIPAGSPDGIRALALLDPLLLVVGFGAILWAFGVETACIAVAYYGVLYGSIFGFVGGAFMRNLWFAAILAGIALWHRGRSSAAGALLTLAASLRVFPAFFLLSPIVSVLAALIRWDPVPRSDLRLLASVVVSSLLLLGGTVVFVGIGSWIGFFTNLHAHTEGLSSNFVGLTSWLRYAVFGIGLGGSVEVEELFAPTGPTYRILGGALLVVSSLLAARLSLRACDPATKLALGLFPIAFALRLAHYYSIALVVLTVAHRSRPDRLAMLFAAEAALYLLAQFETHFSVMCLYRGLITVYLLIALWSDEIRAEARRLGIPRAAGAVAIS